MTKTYMQRSYALFLERHDAKCSAIDLAHKKADRHAVLQDGIATERVKFAAALLLADEADPDSISEKALKKAKRDLENLKDSAVTLGFTEGDAELAENYDPLDARMGAAMNSVGKTYSYVIPVVSKVQGGGEITSKVGEAVAIALSINAEDVVREAVYIYQIRQNMVPSTSKETLMSELDRQVVAYKSAAEKTTQVVEEEFESGTGITLVLGDMKPDHQSVIRTRVSNALLVANRTGSRCVGEVRQSGPKSARFYGFVAGKKFDGTPVTSEFETMIVS